MTNLTKEDLEFLHGLLTSYHAAADNILYKRGYSQQDIDEIQRGIDLLESASVYTREDLMGLPVVQLECSPTPEDLMGWPFTR